VTKAAATTFMAVVLSISNDALERTKLLQYTDQHRAPFHNKPNSVARWRTDRQG